MAREVALIEAPSNLGLAPPAPGKEPGARHMARTLRELGLRAALGAADAGEVMPPAYSAERDVATGIRNVRAIADYSVALAIAIGSQLDAGRFPVVIGGDCSILLGSALALHRRGRYGLVFLDGHQDLQTPQVSRTGGAAGMDLALAVGIGPPVLTALGGNGPLVRAEDVAMLGGRDNPAWYTGDDVVRARGVMQVLSLEQLRRLGMAAAGDAVAANVSRPGLAGAWIHVDVDVLDDAVMAAVDSRQPDGLSYDELDALLGPVLDSGRIVGMHVTIYDPDRDPDLAAGRALVAGLARTLVR
ncbi:MAG TPA: arginase family protein [Gemmatimonadaceae bacterium]|nr:arginase family protein [Gemmatimonadaceae bacterium]